VHIFQKHINKRSAIPLYHQLKELLKEDIHSMQVGELIPTEQELCQHFGISRPTVRQAIAELVSQGYLRRSKGKGTFIAQPKINQDFLLVLESFNREMLEKGLAPATKVLNMEVITAENDTLAERLSLHSTDTIVYLRRLRYVGEWPLVLVSSFIPRKKVPGLENRNLEHQSLYELMEHEYNLNIDRATRSLEAVIGGEEEAAHLDVSPGSAIQYIETVTYLTDGVPIEYSEAWYRGELTRFTFELSKKRV